MVSQGKREMVYLACHFVLLVLAISLNPLWRSNFIIGACFLLSDIGLYDLDIFGIHMIFSSFVTAKS